MYVNLVQVVFVATANQLQNMSGPLLDRLEIIQLSGYTLEEKRHIAEVPAYSDLLSVKNFDTECTGGTTTVVH